MRINTIRITWFRGSADPIAMEPNTKSMVIYGVNGAGKSSFVDAIEYVLNHGKIGHLAHEYSGKHQEKAIPNTHRPDGQKTELTIVFRNSSDVKTEISKDGTATTSGTACGAINGWDYRRTVLRQNEVAEFIHDTKGGKYSALLPLLGLHQMEVAAENLRQLAKIIEQESKLKETTGALKQVEKKRIETFGKDTDEQILRKIEGLHVQYCPDKTATKDAIRRCEETGTSIDDRIARFSSDQRRQVALQGAAELALQDQVNAVRDASSKLAGSVDPLIADKLEILQSTGVFVEKLTQGKDIICPACGQLIPVDDLRAHVRAEREHAQEIFKTFNTRKVAIGGLCDTVKSLKATLAKADVKAWRAELAKGSLAGNFAWLDELNAEALRTSCDEDDLKAIEGKLLSLIDAALNACKESTPDLKRFGTDKQIVETGKAVIVAKEQALATARTEILISFISSLEKGIRDEIRLRSRTVIDAISADIRTMWEILHPGEAIEDVRLYTPEDADKAIDIGLKFHGVEQDSPRLTLSEGYRNSLGLCIFLAMAKREAGSDRPVFLDDVVVSLDRNHRGMIVELLQKEFSGRQVIILTHDREWYTELRQQLDGKSWEFKALLPYETPKLGMRWSHKTTTFDDARVHLKDRPDSAGNDARKIMDIELALIAERLQIRMPFRRGENNDRRMAHEFLERLIVDGKKCFQKKEGKEYVVHSDAINALEMADRLLLSWANRASHTFDLVQPEATKLIDACENALGFFKCSSCGKSVWLADAEGAEWVQCQCGSIRWRYGKS